jgi:glycosyltransferase involved in cell wall biosynthesis
MPIPVTHPVSCADPELILLVPERDVENPELSIVIPAMNERITIADFVEWCKIGLEKAGIEGEILIVDSSSDETPRLALAHGARVLKTPKRGLGRAYIDSIPFIRGKYILMGDADCTYDFRELSGFVEKFRAGFEYVMGSRFKGYIEPDSMPPLHRYFGTPVTTKILNFLYSTRFSDIHCGMRGITKDALIRIDLESQSWEYASEMVLKSVCVELRTAEVPVRFLKDPEGRLSHMKRGGWLEPWRAGWSNLRAMLVYGADFFVLRPGLALLALGLLLLALTTVGPVRIGPVTLSLYWSLAGLTMGVVGLQSFCLGCIVQVIYSYTPAARNRWLRLFEYSRTMTIAAAMAVCGIGLLLPLVLAYVSEGMVLYSLGGGTSRMAVSGLFLLIASFTIGNATLALHAAALRSGKR